METLKEKLTRFESHLQALIEGSTALLFPQVDKTDDLIVRLTMAMQEQCRLVDNGMIVAPNVFQIFASPQYAQELRQTNDNLTKLQENLELAAEKAGFTFLKPPIIQIIEEPMLPHKQVSIHAYIEKDNIPATANLELGGEQPDVQLPKDAFLIINGVKLVPLDKAVVNIGRHPDNQIVINDPRVSRQHAQLRAINGRFILFDLGSTAGTCVNNQRIHQAILSAGDVISIAGIPMVYGQDSNETSMTSQMEYSPPNPTNA
ncbi:MAG: FhaA domain-containing protein [Anaerolineales bacterium]